MLLCLYYYNENVLLLGDGIQLCEKKIVHALGKKLHCDSCLAVGVLHVIAEIR